MTDAIFSLEVYFTSHLEQSNVDSYCQSNIVSDFKTAQRYMYFTGHTTLQCGFSAGKQKFLLILV